MPHPSRSPRRPAALLLAAGAATLLACPTARAADSVTATPPASPATAIEATPGSAAEPMATPDPKSTSGATLSGRVVTINTVAKPRRKKGDRLCGDTAHFFVVAGTSGGSTGSTAPSDPFALYGLRLVKLSVSPIGDACQIRGMFTLQRIPAADATVAITLVDTVLEPVSVIAARR